MRFSIITPANSFGVLTTFEKGQIYEKQICKRALCSCALFDRCCSSARAEERRRAFAKFRHRDANDPEREQWSAQECPRPGRLCTDLSQREESRSCHHRQQLRPRRARLSQ